MCLDEFQDLLVAGDALDGLVRSVIQHHSRAASYVFAGSRPSLMRALFTDQERPFYGQARPLECPALPEREAVEDIVALLAADGLHDDGAVAELVAFSGGHPQRTVLLAHHLYNVLDGSSTAAHPAGEALDRALIETSDGHQALWESLGRPERVVLVALADGQAVSGSRLAAEHRIPRSTLREALERILADERHVQRDGDGQPYLLDPLLGEWLRRR